MNKENKLTPEQEKELIMLSAEIEAEAIKMKMDYEKNPSYESGSVVYVNEQSTLLEDEDERLGDKKVDPKEFDKLWEVKYYRMSKNPIKWWEEEKAIMDEELKLL